MKTKTLLKDGVLIAVSMTISMIETQIPLALPIPGVKPGFANIAGIYAMFTMSAKDCFIVMFLRILLVGILHGNMISFLLSLAGGLFCFLQLCFLKKILNADQIWVAGISGAVFHNLGQILMAVFLYHNPALFYYLPFLMVSGVVSGLLTGWLAQKCIGRLP